MWETYLLQLDADDDGSPIMPVGVQLDAAASGAGAAAAAADVVQAQGQPEAPTRSEAANAELQTHEGEVESSIAEEGRNRLDGEATDATPHSDVHDDTAQP